MERKLTVEDLGWQGEEEPLDVLDLPQLYTRPCAAALLSTLSDIKSEPSSWETTPLSGNSRSISGTTTPLRRQKVKSEGVPAYLTKIVSSALQWIEDDVQKEQIWERASQELSTRSGRTAQGDITRAFNVLLSVQDDVAEVDDTITLMLYEPALTGDNLGHKTWASSFMLAKRLCYMKDILPTDSILELGAGTGLVGMAAACVLRAHVTMTDLPEIVFNLEHNAQSNAALLLQHDGTASAAILDWTHPEDLVLDGSKCLPQSFSLLLAADVVYSEEQPHILASTIDYHMKRSAQARLVIGTPLRDGFDAEVTALRHELEGIELVLADEGQDSGVDDWSNGNDDEPLEVKCWWSIWRWK